MVILYMYHEGLTLEEALDVMLELIREHYDLCTTAEKRVPKTGDAKLDADVQTYIVGCRDLAIGTAYWRQVILMPSWGHGCSAVY
jgi:hypothetical protein